MQGASGAGGDAADEAKGGMSEYQYYEFRAIDRPLGAADQGALRKISTRALITATRFTNTYNWGDFKGDPDRLMERYFDLFLYTANWGSRRLSVRLPARTVEVCGAIPNFAKLESVTVRRRGEHIIFDMWRDEADTEDWGEDEGWLDALAPLRSAALDGDPSLFYLGWLLAVDGGEVPDNALEPPIGLGPMSPAFEAFASFFGMDGDLIEAAAGTIDAARVMAAVVAERYIRGLSDDEKVRLLLELHAGEDPHLGSKLRQRVRSATAQRPSAKPGRTVADLRAIAASIAAERACQAEARAAAEKLQRERKEAAELRRRLESLAQRGESVWKEIEQEIARRNGQGYERATALLRDVRALAERQGWSIEFAHRLGDLRRRHIQKGRFIERLSAARLE